MFGPTRSSPYWSATSYVPNPNNAWNVNFFVGYVEADSKTDDKSVRAVRGGL